MPELIPLIGEFIPDGKDRVILQAADVFCWHKQRVESGIAESDDWRRFERLTHRKGSQIVWSPEGLDEYSQNIVKYHPPKM